eukprot:TRINITY_DN13874_c0_g1_i3.p1 TRINITY_DN13874_c0_g1~~TRINITY_DN13874_c0_g1_i3.p1  ORF type:complete len:172 (+),score=54.61 TRINITY_DN13874_c0_g1_i3:130-645(+)
MCIRDRIKPAGEEPAPAEAAGTQIKMEDLKKIAGYPKRGTTLQVLKEGKVIETIPIDKKPIYNLGRGDEQRKKLGRSTIDIEMRHPSISRKHAIIFHDKNGHCLVMDCHSSHGTRMDGKKVPGGECWRITNGAKLTFGASTRVYQLTGTSTRWDDSEEEEDDYVAKKPRIQ